MFLRYNSTLSAGGAVTINSNVWTDFTPEQITLPFDKTPDKATIEIKLGYDEIPPLQVATTKPAEDDLLAEDGRRLGERQRRRHVEDPLRAAGRAYVKAAPHFNPTLTPSLTVS